MSKHEDDNTVPLNQIAITLNPEQLVAALESVRKYVCPYMKSNSCDCKYGAHTGLRLYPQAEKQLQGEITGCPEIRIVQELLLAIKKKDFDAITQKMISNEFNDPGKALRKIRKIASKYGAGLRWLERGTFQELEEIIEEYEIESSRNSKPDERTTVYIQDKRGNQKTPKKNG